MLGIYKSESGVTLNITRLIRIEGIDYYQCHITGAKYPELISYNELTKILANYPIKIR